MRFSDMARVFEEGQRAYKPNFNSAHVIKAEMCQFIMNGESLRFVIHHEFSIYWTEHYILQRKTMDQSTWKWDAANHYMV